MSDNIVVIDDNLQKIVFKTGDVETNFIMDETSVNYTFGDTTVVERGGSLGWGVYRDTEKAILNPQSIMGGVKTLLENNNGSSFLNLKHEFANHNFINNNRIWSKKNRDSYTFRIGFYADSEIINNEVQIMLDIGGDVGVIQLERIELNRGVGIPKFYTANFVVYALDTFLQNGVGVYLEPDGNIHVWGAEYFIRVEDT